ncbi:hypothetical protein ADK75_05205 [Streptomyces virginiae]|uniref:Uncharacterized protein n=1 Tax=Streptomyces virginiae TaxID=1961 RepID=A0A0L8N3K6_STRVG|nr:hypothetical protein ADK75_05205 [Streptomyces virginiae]
MLAFFHSDCLVFLEYGHSIAEDCAQFGHEEQVVFPDRFTYRSQSSPLPRVHVFRIICDRFVSRQEMFGETSCGYCERRFDGLFETAIYGRDRNPTILD